MDTTWKVTALGASLLFVGSASSSERHAIWLHQVPVMGCHTDTVCLVLSFPGREQSLHIASGSHRVPPLAADPVLKQQMYSWSHSFGNKASVAYLKECQVWSWEHRTQLHGFGN